MNCVGMIMDLGDKYVDILHNTKINLQCGNAYFDDGYAHIVSIAMPHAVFNTCLTCGITGFSYVSNKRLAISPELLFCALQLWYLSFIKQLSCHDNNDEWMLLEYM